MQNEENGSAIAPNPRMQTVILTGVIAMAALLFLEGGGFGGLHQTDEDGGFFVTTLDLAVTRLRANLRPIARDELCCIESSEFESLR